MIALRATRAPIGRTCASARSYRRLAHREVHVIRSKYWNPADDSIVTGQVATEQDLFSLVIAASELRGDRGIPAVQLIRPDGSSLTIATDGLRCCLVWVYSLGASFQTLIEMSGGS